MNKRNNILKTINNNKKYLAVAFGGLMLSSVIQIPTFANTNLNSQQQLDSNIQQELIDINSNDYYKDGITITKDSLDNGNFSELGENSKEFFEQGGSIILDEGFKEFFEQGNSIKLDEESIKEITNLTY